MSESKRVFFAIEIPPTIQKQLVRWRAENFSADAGVPVAAANLHITLAFLGEVSAEKQRALSRSVDELKEGVKDMHRLMLKTGPGMQLQRPLWTLT